ncbi:Protein kinase superfamily protein with octicosapeptide/Phox/Bem1p domain [Euphorbia peplus]|nr:Protein kinase superfamily protein with octicosapeptide/Phox/Bem1p domain [Euphorbia peplus]
MSKNLSELMTRETSSGQCLLIQQQEELASFVPKIQKNVHNISVQTGEEFSMEFLQDRVNTRGVILMPSMIQNCENKVRYNNDQNCYHGYEDLADILGIRRIDSVSTDGNSDFMSAKGSLLEIENGAYFDKLNRPREDESDHVIRSGKAFSELNLNQGTCFGPSSASAISVPKSARSSNFCELNDSDRPQPGKMKLLCSFGGKVLPRPSDGKLRYVGGETRIFSVCKNLTWEELVKKTKCICTQPHSIKYQLPGEDLDALISVSSDEDLQNMIEESHGLETLVGSQRLRIFLIPLDESKKTSSFEAANIQQDSPNYQYVVAVNGIIDASHKKNSGGHGSASEDIQPAKNSLQSPSFRKDSPPPLFPLENKSGQDAFNPVELLNVAQTTNRPPYYSSPLTPVPLHHQDPTNICIKLHADKSSIESSSSSFFTARLPPENGSMSAVDKQLAEGLAALVNDNHPCKNVDEVKPEQLHEVHPHNHHFGAPVIPSIFQISEGDFDSYFSEKLTQKDRTFHSEKLFTGPEDSMGIFSGYVGSINTHHGMPHAFSDSKLQEHGGFSVYCSQEGMSPSSPLSFPKIHIPSEVLNASPEKQLQLNGDVNFVDSTLQNEDNGCIGLNGTLNLLSLSPYSKSPGRNGLIQKASISADETSNHCEENLLGVGNANNIDKASPYLHHGQNSCSARGGHMPRIDSSQIFSDVGTSGQAVDMSEDSSPALSAIDLKPSLNDCKEHSRYYQAPSAVLAVNHRIGNDQYGCFNSRVNGDPGSRIPRTSRPEIVDIDHHVELLHGGDSLVTLISGSSSIPVSPGRSRTLHMASPNGIDGNNTTKDASHERKVYHINRNDGIYCDQKIEKSGFGGSFENASGGDIMFTQTISQTKDHSRQEPLITVEGPTDAFHNVQSSSAFPYIADPLSSDFRFPMATEAGSIMPHVSIPSASESNSMIPPVCTYVANPFSNDCQHEHPTASVSDSAIAHTDLEDMKDDNVENKDKSISDSVMAEMEACIYGLQIIKNVDLEELRELGSGTYGTVYHGKWRGTDVAIKRIKRSCFSGKSSEQERLTTDFWREAQILSKLHHPNVLSFYGIVPDGAGGTLATVTEYMVNGSLRHALVKKDRSLDYRKKLIIAMDAAFGMEYLHSKNIVHFDLKCDNLLVNLRDPQRPICKVADFGLSRIKRNTLVSGGVRGTLPWMAPELLNGSSNRVSEKVDVFSYGIALWEILTGEEPYADMHCGAIIGGIVKNTLRPPIPEWCDPEWRTLMEQCWSPEPEFRPSFTEITRSLRTMSLTFQAKWQAAQARLMKEKQVS